MKVMTIQQVKKIFGDFKYIEGEGGRVKILGDWQKKYITYAYMPIIGFVHCHKEVLFDLFKIFYYIERLGLSKHIDIQDTRKNGGCFVPRHKLWDPKRSLSPHAWGIAIDINPSTNGYGQIGNMHRGIIQVFADHKWLNGGAWKPPDFMHFEPSDHWKPFKPITELLRNEK